jgi:Cu-Zn family superoxide dismutase
MNGDLTNGCTSAGAHYNPLNMTHGSIRSEVRHIGDLSNIIADANGNVHMRAYTDQISLFGEFSIVGRAVVVHAKEDDLGKGGDA